MRLLSWIAFLFVLAAPVAAKSIEVGGRHAVPVADQGALSDWRTCLPDGVSKDQVRATVQAWLKMYPKYRDVAISTLLAKLEAWLRKYPEFRDVAVAALVEKANAWLRNHPEYRDVPAATLIAQDLSEGLPCR
ncbi:MAG: hypothetical protein O2967_13770 [Proteobacteria bacterium]|nr:hypothetical protein [Pseudomonadota bacterium]